MDLLNKLTIKNLKLNKKRTVVTIIGIMLSIALITAVSSMYFSGINSIIKFEKQVKGNYHVAYLNVPAKDLNIFKSNRSIEKNFFIKNDGYAKISSQNDGKPYAYIREFTKDSLSNLAVNLKDGRLPQNENEILIPSHLETNGRVYYKIGDKITLEVGKRVTSDDEKELSQQNPYDRIVDYEKIINTTKKTYKIVGIIERPPVEIEAYYSPGYTFITYFNENNNFDSVDVFSLYKKESLKNIYKITANIIGIDEDLFVRANKNDFFETKEELDNYTNMIKKAKYNILVNSYLINLEKEPFKVNGMGQIGVVAGIVIGIIIFSSIFCIKNSFDISITEKTKQYGMLRSVGATKKQIKKNVFYEASILGLIGIPLGILLGNIATYILIFVSNILLKDVFTNNLKLIYSFSLISIVIGVVLGVVTIYLSAIRSALKSSHISPIDSIRNSGEIKINNRKIKSLKIIKRLFGIGGEISYKNIKRNKKKYRTTIISLTVSVLTFIALSGFIGIGFSSVKNQFKATDFNLELITSDKITAEVYKNIEDSTKLNNIIDTTILRQDELKIDKPIYNEEYVKWLKLDEKDKTRMPIPVVAVGKEQYQKYIKDLNLKYEDIKNKMILADYSEIKELANNPEEDIKARKKMMRILDYKKGDNLNVISNSNKQIEMEIGYVTKKLPFGLTGEFSTVMIASDEYFNTNFNFDYLKVLYKSNDAKKLQNEIYNSLKGFQYDLNNTEENVNRMISLLILISIFLYGFIIVVSLIGITNIFNTITTSIELRKREFAMLKSVGMTTKEFNKMIRLESFFIGFKSLIFGIPIGLILSYLIYNFMGKREGIPYSIPMNSIIISIIVVFGLIYMIMDYSIKKINKQNIIETIRNENI